MTVVDVAATGIGCASSTIRPRSTARGFYGDAEGDYPDNAWRFGLFCRAALEAIRDGRAAGRRAAPARLAHGSGGRVPRRAIRGRPDRRRPAAILLTLHNLAYHGWVPPDHLRELGLRPGDGVLPAGADGLDLLATGIERAELSNTVSPTFAAEALTPAFGMGVDGLLRSKGDRFFGILNGLDTTVWDPAADGDIAAAYSSADLTGKAACRADLLERVGFDPDEPGMVFGMIGRLDPQKGFDLVAGAAPAMLERGGRIVVQGSGHPDLAEPFRRLAAAKPDRVALVERFDRVMARRIYAGADAFLMPSRFEPCGQGQMIALRYGTPPVVHRTGGLADTVVDVTRDAAAGTGFVFEKPTPAALAEACDRAMTMRAAGGRPWAGLLDRGMAVDFDWVTGSAPRYVEAYRRAVAIRAATVR